MPPKKSAVVKTPELKKKVNKWISFVKEYSIKNNKPYRDCLKDETCKQQYKNSV